MRKRRPENLRRGEHVRGVLCRNGVILPRRGTFHIAVFTRRSNFSHRGVLPRQDVFCAGRFVSLRICAGAIFRTAVFSRVKTFFCAGRFVSLRICAGVLLRRSGAGRCPLLRAYSTASHAEALSEVSAKFPRRYSKYPAAAIMAALSPQSERSGTMNRTPRFRHSSERAARR